MLQHGQYKYFDANTHQHIMNIGGTDTRVISVGLGGKGSCRSGSLPVLPVVETQQQACSAAPQDPDQVIIFCLDTKNVAYFHNDEWFIITPAVTGLPTTN